MELDQQLQVGHDCSKEWNSSPSSLWQNDTNNNNVWDISTPNSSPQLFSSQLQLSKLLKQLTIIISLIIFKKIITNQTFEMGNTQQKEIQITNDYQIIEQNYYDHIMLLYSKRTNEEYLGRKIIINSKEDVDKMDRLISYKNNQENKFISRLVFSYKHSVGYCNLNVQYLLIFQKGAFSLKQEVYNRRFKFQTFQQAQIMIILESVMKALLFLKEIGLPHKRICTQNIFIRNDRSIFLSDPWLFPQKQTSIYKMNETGYIYPSPQKILFQNDLVNSYNYYLSDYYTLAIVLIQLINMEPMDCLYQKGFRRIMEKQLIKEINKIKKEGLREVVKVMVNHYPEKRKEVQKYYRKKTNASYFINQEIYQFKSKIANHQNITINKNKDDHYESQQEQKQIKKPISKPMFIPNNSIVHEKAKIPKINFSYIGRLKTQQTQKSNIVTNEHLGELKKIVDLKSDNIKQEQNNPTKKSNQNSMAEYQVSNSLQEQLIHQIENQSKHNQFKQFHNLIKQTQSINASIDDKSQIASQVIGHGFSAKNSYSIGLNSKPQLQQDVRTSMPIKSFQEESKSIQNMNKSTQIKNQADQKMKSSNQKLRQHTQTPDKPVKKRNNSTIKEVSEQSPSFDQIQPDQRTIQYDVGTKYIGQIKNGKRNGKGIFYFQDGSFYQGSWKQNKMHGKGSLYYSNGHIAYDGGWYSDSFHGKGRIYNDNPRELQKQFNYNNMNFIDQYWQVYDGDFFNQKKSGNGKLKLSNGQVFVGQFKDDKINGQGKFYQLNGNIVYGKWFEGILVKQYSS